MGYGLLFIGYAAAFLMSFNSFGFIFRAVGSLLAVCGLKKLCQFETKYNFCYLSAWAMCLAAMAEGAVFVMGDYTNLPENLQAYVSMAFYLFAIPFHLIFYRATSALSKEVGLDKIAVKSARNAVFCVIVILLALSSFAAHSFDWSFINYLFGATLVGLLLLVFMNLLLIYSCYKNICEEGDEENAAKPSRIPFLNKLFEASDKRQQEIYEKTKAYAEERIKRDNEKKLEKRKKKGKKK